MLLPLLVALEIVLSADNAIALAAIARALERRGHRVNANGIAAHRGESCACARR